MSERSENPSRRARLLRGLIVSVGVALLVDQVVNWTVLADGWLLGRRIAPFDPPLFTREQEESLERLKELSRGGPPSGVVRFDAEIGWASPRGESAGGSWYDEFGARRSSREEVTPEIAARPKLLLVGCSFTHGDEVAANETWGFAVQSQGKWNVFNCGVGGYGIDQAERVVKRVAPLLRPERILLGVLPKAIPRIYSVYRPAMRHHEPSVSFKPALDSLNLDKAFENPARTPLEAVDLLTTPGRFFETVAEHDFFVLRYPFAYLPQGSRLWQRSAIARLFVTMAEARNRVEFDPSAFETNPDSLFGPTNLIESMQREAERIGATFSFVILPDADDLSRYGAGKPALPALRSLWTQKRRPALEIESALLAGGVRPGPEFFALGGHYSAKTNRIVAEAIGAALR